MKRFRNIFVEKDIEDLSYTKELLKNLKNPDYTLIDDYSKIFAVVKKPYLQKRNKLDLFIARKTGELVKEAPNAYGLSGERHYYFIHAYNCIYECQYCYLQGYFNSPDIVLFVNHDEIINQMKSIMLETKTNNRIWFHAGEFSDSLALSHITNELEPYWGFFKKFPNAILELRTKSANIKTLEKLEALPNTVISFSMSPEKEIKEYDLLTAGLKGRLKSIEQLAEKGFRIGLHFDPIIYSDDIYLRYQKLFEDILKVLPIQNLAYISLGVVRFTKDVYFEVERNYPDSGLLQESFIKSFDNKIRYKRPMRLKILEKMKSLLINVQIPEEKVYFCMEDE
jgi:spore photoproduct lyase